MKIDVSQGPWWWIRVFDPGWVVTTEEYNPTEPATPDETPMDRSMSACWPIEVWRWAGVIRMAMPR